MGLAKLVSYYERNFSGIAIRLGANIDLAAYGEGKAFNDDNGWIPIGCEYNPFNGTFDGNNKVIKNLFINDPDMDCVGLFGCVDNGTIKNLGVENINIIGKDRIGGITGTLDRKVILSKIKYMLHELIITVDDTVYKTLTLRIE